VQRQVTGGRDRGFDGVFETNGQVHVIEVEYISKKGRTRGKSSCSGCWRLSARQRIAKRPA
jgi:hypothetical protein